MQESSNKLLERIIVYSSITSFMLAILVCFNLIMGNTRKINGDFINWFTLLFTAVSGFIYELVLQIFSEEKTSSKAHFVFLPFYVIFELLLCFFTGQLNLAFFMVPFSIVHYILEANYNLLFVYHDYFLQQNGERNGKELVEYLFHNSFTAQDFAQTRRKNQNYLVALGLIMAGFLIMTCILATGVNALLVIFVLIFYFCLFVSCWILGIFNRESYYAFLGFKDASKGSRHIFKYCLLIMAAAAVFGFAFSSNKSLLDLSRLPKGEQKIEVPTAAPQAPAEYMPLDFGTGGPGLEFFVPEKTSNIGWIIELIFKVIKNLCICLAAIGILAFLIRPFFSDDWKKYWRERKFVIFLKKIGRELKDMLRSLFSKDAAGKSYSRVDNSNFKDGIEDFLKRSRKSKEKRQELDRLTKVFMKLIDWGVDRKINYTKNLAPAEYTSKVADFYRAADRAVNKVTGTVATSFGVAEDFPAACKAAGSFFEKALYDKELLSAEEEKSFTSAIDLLIHSGVKIVEEK